MRKSSEENAIKSSDNLKKMKMFHLLKITYLQYNRIDPNKRFDNFITGRK